ncbi:MAG: HAMP domain-containing sensor histidine kinase [Bacteroidia bacterium]|nr:HAMP domain-containing sensor histidine kinase [Bacteroidia bacterium]
MRYWILLLLGLLPAIVRGEEPVGYRVSHDHLQARLDSLERHYKIDSSGKKVALLIRKAELLDAQGRSLADKRLALIYYQEAARQLRAEADLGTLGRVWLNISRIYGELGSFSASLWYGQEAFAALEPLGDSLSLIRLNILLGQVCLNAGIPQYCLRHSSWAWKNIQGMPGHDSLKAAIMILIANYHQANDPVGKRGVARAYLHGAGEYLQAVPQTPAYGPLKAQYYITEAEIALSEHQPDSARRYLQAISDQVRIKSEFGQIAVWHRLQAAYWLQVGNLSQAYTSLDRAWSEVAVLGIWQEARRIADLRVDLAIGTQDSATITDTWLWHRYVIDSLMTIQASQRYQLIMNQLQAGKLEEMEKAYTDQHKVLAEVNDKLIWTALITIVLLVVLGSMVWGLYLRSRYQQQLEQQLVLHQQELGAERIQSARLTDELNNLATRSAHELREPLALVIGLSIMTQEEQDPDKLYQYTRMISNQARRMDILLHKFMDVQNVNSHMLHLSLFSPLEELHKVLTTYQEMIEEKNLRVDIAVPGTLLIHTDAWLLHMIMSKLVENACMYAGAGTDRYLRITTAQTEDHWAIQFLDNGAGIRPEAETKLFSMFFRGDYTAGGVGLGLYTARLAAGRTGAEVVYNPAARPMTEFIIRIPKQLHPSAATH